MVVIDADSPCSLGDAIFICLAEVFLEFWPGLVHGIEHNPLEDGHFKEAQFLDGQECLVNHVLYCEWGLGDNGLYKIIFEVVIQVLDWVDWVPRGAKRFLTGLLLQEW